MRDTATAAEREEQGHRAEDHHEVARLDREDEEHEERPGWEVEREGHQQAVDRTGRAHRRRIVELIGEWKRQDAEQYLREAGAEAAREIELREVLRSPHALQLDADEVQREHVEENVREAGVHEHVGDELPDGELSEQVRGTQSQPNN